MKLLKARNLFLLSFFTLALSSCGNGLSKTNDTIKNEIIDSQVNPVTDVTITFEENGGTLSGLKQIKTNSDTEFKDIKNKPTVYREGVSVQPGWYKNTDNGKEVITDSTKFSSDTVLLANWTLYTVTFDAGDGSFADGTKTKEFKDVTVIHSDKIDAPTLDAHTFAGWRVNGNVVNFPYAPSGDSTNITVTAEYTTSESVNVAFLAGDGSFASSSKSMIVSIPYGTTYKQFIDQGLGTTPTYNGDKEFSVWNMNNNVIADTYTFVKPVVLTAYYTDAVSITFDVSTNGGDWTDTAPSATDSFIKNEGLMNKNDSLLTNSNGKNRTTRKFKLFDNPKFIQFKQDVYTSTPKKGNIEFLGWFDNPEANGEAYTDEMIINATHSFTLYAYYKDPYYISVTGDGVDTISKPSYFIRKDTVTCTFKAQAGYTLSDDQIEVSWNGSVKTKGEDYTFSVTGGIGTLTITDAQPYNITIDLSPTTNTYNISASSVTGATITSGTSSLYKASNTVKATADTGYLITGIKVTNNTTKAVVKYSEASGASSLSVTYNMPASDVTITTTVKQIEYTITVKKDAGISSASADKTTYHYNDNVTITAGASTGYSLKDVTGDASATFSGSTATFKMPAKNSTVTVNSNHISYDITLSNQSNVSSSTAKVSGTAVTSAYYNSTVVITGTASTGYSLDYILVGSSTTKIYFSSGSASFTMPNAKTTVKIYAKVNSYSVSVTKGGGVKTASASATTVDYGSTVTITATASTGYTLKNISYKYGSTTKTATFSSGKATFKMPAGDVTVTVNATQNDYTVTVSMQTGVATATASKTSSCHYGDTITITASASSGYTLSYIKVGSTITTFSETTASFTMPNANTTVYVYAVSTATSYNISSITYKVDQNIIIRKGTSITINSSKFLKSGSWYCAGFLNTSVNIPTGVTKTENSYGLTIDGTLKYLCDVSGAPTVTGTFANVVYYGKTLLTGTAKSTWTLTVID